MKGVMRRFTEDGRDFTVYLVAVPPLEGIQEAVGGSIEAVPGFDTIEVDGGLRVPCVAFCDEEGKLKRRPINVTAQNLWMKALDGRFPNDVLAGDVVVIYGDDELMRDL